MIAITNTLFQPLTLPTASGAGIHLLPRGRVTLKEADVSEAIRRAVQRGFITLRSVVPAASVATATSDASASESAPAKANKRKEG